MAARRRQKKTAPSKARVTSKTPRTKVTKKKRSLTRPAITGSTITSTRPPIVIAGPPVVVGPPDHIGNFFDTDRAGRAVVRPNDLVAIRLELHNLTVTPGNPPRLKKQATGAAHLVLH